MQDDVVTGCSTKLIIERRKCNDSTHLYTFPSFEMTTHCQELKKKFSPEDGSYQLNGNSPLLGESTFLSPPTIACLGSLTQLSSSRHWFRTEQLLGFRELFEHFTKCIKSKRKIEKLPTSK